MPDFSSRCRLRIILPMLFVACEAAAAAPEAPGHPAVRPNGEMITMARAVQMAVSASHKRRKAEYDLTSQTARRRAALADLGPRIALEASDVRFDKSVMIPFGGDMATVRPDHILDGSLSVTQPVTGLYTNWQRSRVERSAEKIAQLTVDLSGADAAFGTAEVYLRAQQAAEMINISMASIAATEAQVHDAEALLTSGRLIKSDLLRIKIAEDEARAALARATADRDKVYELLRYDLGLAEDANFAIESLPTVEKVIQQYESVAASTSHDAYQGRLELKQAQMAVDKAANSQKVVHMKFAPQINLFMKWDRIYSTPLAFGTPDYTRTVGVAATWDLWDNGSRVLAEQEVSAQVKKAGVAVEETREQLRLELSSLFADVRATREALAARMSAMTQAEEAYRIDKARFGIGLVTATDLVLSEASQTRARGALLASLTEINVLLLKIKKATGALTPQ